MFKLMHKARKNQKGFTLVELMVVVVIIGILVAIPIYTTVQNNAKVRADAANVRILKGSASMMLAENSPLADAVSWTSENEQDGATGWGQYLEAWPINPFTNLASYTVGIAVNGTITIGGDGDGAAAVVPVT